MKRFWAGLGLTAVFVFGITLITYQTAQQIIEASPASEITAAQQELAAAQIELTNKLNELQLSNDNLAAIEAATDLSPTDKTNAITVLHREQVRLATEIRDIEKRIVVAKDKIASAKNNPPTATITPDKERITEGESVKFTASAQDADGWPLTITWSSDIGAFNRPTDTVSPPPNIFPRPDYPAVSNELFIPTGIFGSDTTFTKIATVNVTVSDGQSDVRATLRINIFPKTSSNTNPDSTPPPNTNGGETPAPVSQGGNGGGGGTTGTVATAPEVKLTNYLKPKFATFQQLLQVGIPNLLISFAGLVALFFLLINGVRYLFASGNEKVTDEAKKGLTFAAIGLAVVVFAYLAVNLISGLFS
jgi:hypothetical protein